MTRLDPFENMVTLIYLEEVKICLAALSLTLTATMQILCKEGKWILAVLSWKGIRLNAVHWQRGVGWGGVKKKRIPVWNPSHITQTYIMHCRDWSLSKSVYVCLFSLLVPPTSPCKLFSCPPPAPPMEQSRFSIWKSLTTVTCTLVLSLF